MPAWVSFSGLLGSRARKQTVHEKDELEGGLAEEDDKPEKEQAKRRRPHEAQRVYEMQHTAHRDEGPPEESLA